MSGGYLELPEFVKILKILELRSQWVIFGKLLETYSFDYSLLAFEVTEPKSHYKLIVPGSESDCNALSIYPVGRDCDSTAFQTDNPCKQSSTIILFSSSRIVTMAIFRPAVTVTVTKIHYDEFTTKNGFVLHAYIQSFGEALTTTPSTT